MAPANQQIITAYEDCGMSPEDIAADLGYEVEAVKMILLQHSSVFSDKALTRANESRELVVKDEEVFGTADIKIAKATIKELCLHSEVDTVRFRAAEFMINEAKGRNDLRALKESNFNIVMISETMTKAREAMSRAKQRAREVAQARQTIDVPSIA